MMNFGDHSSMTLLFYYMCATNCSCVLYHRRGVQILFLRYEQPGKVPRIICRGDVVVGDWVNGVV